MRLRKAFREWRYARRLSRMTPLEQVADAAAANRAVLEAMAADGMAAETVARELAAIELGQRLARAALDIGDVPGFMAALEMVVYAPYRAVRPAA